MCSNFYSALTHLVIFLPSPKFHTKLFGNLFTSRNINCRISNRGSEDFRDILTGLLNKIFDRLIALLCPIGGSAELMIVVGIWSIERHRNCINQPFQLRQNISSVNQIGLPVGINSDCNLLIFQPA